MTLLVESPAFRKFLFRIVEAAGICVPASKADVALHAEGKRSLGLEILGWVDDALPESTKSPQPLGALHLAIAEELAPKEKRSDRPNRYDESDR